MAGNEDKKTENVKDAPQAPSSSASSRSPERITFDPASLSPPNFNTEEYDRRATLYVFRTIVELFLFALLIYFVMMVCDARNVDKFAQVIMSPLLTILAGAAGFYFGNKQK